MTHDEIVELSAKWLKRHKQNVVVPNCPIVVTELRTLNVTGETPDVIGFCGWSSVLLEIKVSRSDFLRDKRKLFRIYPE